MSNSVWATYKANLYESGKMTSIRIGFGSPSWKSYTKLLQLKKLLINLNIRYKR